MIGETIGEYLITEFLGQGDLEVFWKGHNLFSDAVVRVRVMKPEYSANVSLRNRYLARFRADAALSHMTESVDFHVLDANGSLCIVVPWAAWELPQADAVVGGVYEKYAADEVTIAVAARRKPTALQLEEYHRRVQLFAKVALVVGVIFGVMTLVIGVGLFFLASAVGAVGLLQRRKWGRIWILVSHIAMMTIAIFLDIGMVEEMDKHQFNLSLDNIMLILALGVPWLAYSVWGLVEMYSWKASDYFR